MPNESNQPAQQVGHQRPDRTRLHGHGRLERMSHGAIDILSGPWGTVALLGFLVAWALAIPLFGWLRTYRAVVDLASVVSFVLLFLILRAQTKAMLSLQVKLNELLAAVHRASPELINVEDRSESEVRDIHDRFQEIQQRGPGEHSIADSLEVARESGSEATEG
jgi:low affinity Fe/Cu permease